jgi:predicted transcriptional regulator YdeE
LPETRLNKQTIPRLAAFGLVAVLALASAEPGKVGRMTPRISHVHSFMVVGISARTNNTKEMTPDGVIGRLWGRLAPEGFLAKVAIRADENIVAVYTDYASDKNGDYTYILGAKVSGDSEIPAGMVAKKIPSGKYAVFTSERGPTSTVVPEAWQKINNLPKNAPGGDRTYQSDFEVYDARARNPHDAVVDVYIGIR